MLKMLRQARMCDLMRDYDSLPDHVVALDIKLQKNDTAGVLLLQHSSKEDARP